MSDNTQALLIMRERYMSQATRETFKLCATERITVTPDQLEKLAKFVAGCMASAALDVLRSGA